MLFPRVTGKDTKFQKFQKFRLFGKMRGLNEISHAFLSKLRPKKFQKLQKLQKFHASAYENLLLLFEIRTTKRLREKKIKKKIKKNSLSLACYFRDLEEKE